MLRAERTSVAIDHEAMLVNPAAWAERDGNDAPVGLGFLHAHA